MTIWELIDEENLEGIKALIQEQPEVLEQDGVYNAIVGLCIGGEGYEFLEGTQQQPPENINSQFIINLLSIAISTNDPEVEEDEAIAYTEMYDVPHNSTVTYEDPGVEEEPGTIFDLIDAGNQQGIQALIGENPAVLQETDEDGDTPLFAAVGIGDSEIVTIIINAIQGHFPGEAGLEIINRVIDGGTALDMADVLESGDIVVILEAAGAIRALEADLDFYIEQAYQPIHGTPPNGTATHEIAEIEEDDDDGDYVILPGTTDFDNLPPDIFDGFGS